MITTRTVVKTWLDGQMRPCAGSVQFQLNAPLEEDPGIRAVVPSLVTATLDAAGGMSVELPTTDVGPGAVYKVTPLLVDGQGRQLFGLVSKCNPDVVPLRPFYVVIPAGSGDLELPPATYPDSGYVAVQGPSGPGVLFLQPGESVPPGTVPPMLVVRPA